MALIHHALTYLYYRQNDHRESVLLLVENSRYIALAAAEKQPVLLLVENNHIALAAAGKQPVFPLVENNHIALEMSSPNIDLRWLLHARQMAH